MNLKAHKRELILSSLLFLLPMAVGLILWNRLPDSMYIHWGVNNQPDGTGSKAFVVFGFPLMLLVLHWFALWITSKDPKHQNQGRKATAILFWIIPLLSCFLSLFFPALKEAQSPEIRLLLAVNKILRGCFQT